MTTKDTDSITVDPATGEILTQATGALEGAVLPAARDGRFELTGPPATLDELIAQYTEPEPGVVEVFSWIMAAAEMPEDGPEDSQLSIMLRIMQGTVPDEILGSQEVMSAGDLLGETLHINGVKFKRSSFSEGAACYALISAHRETTDTDVVISCGGKNVQTQLLNMRERGFLPFKAAVLKASKPTANGFYPLWLEPR